MLKHVQIWSCQICLEVRSLPLGTILNSEAGPKGVEPMDGRNKVGLVFADFIEINPYQNI